MYFSYITPSSFSHTKKEKKVSKTYYIYYVKK